VSRPALMLTHPPVQWVSGVLSPRVKHGRGLTLTAHLHPGSRSRMSRSYTSSPPCTSISVLWNFCWCTWRLCGGAEETHENIQPGWLGSGPRLNSGTPEYKAGGVITKRSHLWNIKERFLARFSPPAVSILSWMNPVTPIYLRSILILSSRLYMSF
jgi:hypothetical protein